MLKTNAFSFGTFLASFFLLFLLFSCQKRFHMTYQYADGSGNRYRLHQDSLKYIPVKPEMSSSGIYDGGDPQSVHLSHARQEELIKLLT